MKCKQCNIGRFQSAKMPYMMMLDNKLLVLPNVTALRCDVCGNVQFNEVILERVQYLLHKLAQGDIPTQTADRLAISEQLAHWHSSGRNS
jgi:hypothetical protein